MNQIKTERAGHVDMSLIRRIVMKRLDEAFAELGAYEMEDTDVCVLPGENGRNTQSVSETVVDGSSAQATDCARGARERALTGDDVKSEVPMIMRTDDQGDDILIVDGRDFYHVRRGRGNERCHLCPFFREDGCKQRFVDAVAPDDEGLINCSNRRLVYYNPGRMRGYLVDKAVEELGL